ncbi:MAG: N-acetylmuramoyl-L-alanine amidase family protein [Planctomycetota bacterium]
MKLFNVTIILLILGTSLAGDAEDYVSYAFLDSFCDTNNFNVRHDGLTDRYILTGGDMEIVLVPGMAQARICGFAVSLGGPVKIESGRISVPRDLQDKLAEVREKMRKQVPAKSRSELTIVLDPGHGPTWYGGVSQDGLMENIITLPIANVVKAELEKKGYRVVLTRTRNVHLNTESRADDLDARVNATYAARGDIFVSIHVNSTNPPDPDAVGVETFYYPPFPVGSTGMTLDERASAMAKRNADLRHITGAKFSGDSGALTALCRTVLEINAGRSRALAQSLQGALVKATGDVDRGVKNSSNLRVLRMQACPAALVEVGFLTNFATARKLRQASYRNGIAKSIAEGIDSFACSEGNR